MNKIVSEINECFNNGYIPDGLFYTIEKDKISIDPRKISYTDYYQSEAFYNSKFNVDTSLLGFDKLIECMSIQAKQNNNTPLKEITELQNYNLDINNNGINTNLFKQSDR